MPELVDRSIGRRTPTYSGRWPAVLLLAALTYCHSTFGSEPVIHRDVDYRPDLDHRDNRDRLDIHMPADAENAPVVIWFHGGALRMGEKAWGDPVAERLLPEGVGLVSANYRLTPEVMHPAHVEDAAAAVAWVVENIEQYGGDPDNIYLAGHSAGAYLAVLLSIDGSCLARHGLDSSTIRGTIAISPFLYVEETAKVRPKDVWGEDPAAWMAASVTPHIGPGKGRMLLIFADGDDPWRREQNRRFARAMQDAGNAGYVSAEVTDRDHYTLITEINADDDEVGTLLAEFIRDR